MVITDIELGDLSCNKQSGSWTCTEFSTLLDPDGDGSLQWSVDDGDASVGDNDTTLNTRL